MHNKFDKKTEWIVCKWTEWNSLKEVSMLNNSKECWKLTFFTKTVYEILEQWTQKEFFLGKETTPCSWNKIGRLKWFRLCPRMDRTCFPCS